MRRTDFLSVKTTTIYLFFKYYLVKNRLQNKQKSLIAKKLYIEDGDLLFMIPEFYTFVVSYFGIKVVTENLALF